MVYHVNDYVAATSELIYDLDTQLDNLNRCQEMIMRINAMKPTDTLPKDVLDYISEYASTEEFSIHFGSGEGGIMSTIKKVLGAIKAAIVKVIEIIHETFRVLFDSQYRHRKAFIDINKNLIVFSADPEAVKQFETIPCTVLSQQNVCIAEERSKRLISLLKFCIESTDNEDIDDLLRNFTGPAFVKYVDNRLVDSMEDLQAEHFSSFAEAGWTLDGLQKATTKHIDTITGIEVLKDSQKKLEREINQLNNEVNAAMQHNSTVDNIQGLQKRTALRIRQTRLIGSAIEILVKRAGAINTILKAINAETDRVRTQRSETARG